MTVYFLFLIRLETKYMYVCHAEMNAIMNKNSASVEGCTMYVALFPCNECAKMIIQVVFLSDPGPIIVYPSQ